MNEDTLLTLAEVAAGLIGLAAIGTIFVTKDTIERLDRLRFYFIVNAGLFVIVCSFIPFWVEELYGFDERFFERSFYGLVFVGLGGAPWVLAMLLPILSRLQRTIVICVSLLLFGFLLVIASGVSFALKQAYFEMALMAVVLTMAGVFVNLVVDRKANQEGYLSSS